VNCREIDEVLSEQLTVSRLIPEAQQHLKDCPRCQELLRTLTQRYPLDAPSTAVLEQIERSMTTDLRPVRPMASPRHFAAAFAGIVVAGLIAGAYVGGTLGLNAMSSLQAWIMFGGLTIATGVLIQSLVSHLAPGARHLFPPKLIPAAVLLALAAIICAFFTFQYEPHFLERGWSCLRVGTPIALLSVIPFWLLLRRGALLSPTVTGTATGLLAGLVGTSVLEVHCPNFDAWHRLVSHLGVATIGALAGLAVGFVFEVAGRNAGRGLRNHGPTLLFRARPRKICDKRSRSSR
jgi:hypothetical protein